MKSAYRVLTIVIAIGVAAQVAFIAFGTFTTSADAEDGVTIDSAYKNSGLDLHSIGGSVIAVLVLALLIVSFFAKVNHGVRNALILVGLVALQFVLAMTAYGLPAIGLLHGLNGLAIAGFAGMAGRQVAAPAKADAPAKV